MEPEIKLAYTILVYISAIAIFFAPFGLIFSAMCLKTVHFNLRFLSFTLGLLWCILPIGGMYFYFILSLDENPPFLYQKFDYLIAKNICAVAAYGFRIIETSICFERLLATIFFEKYENNKIFRIYSLFATFISIGMTASLSFLYNVLHFTVVVIYTFMFSVEMINFVLLHILKKRNHELRQMSNSRRALLSSKYQLIENIKSLQLLFPQTSISFVLSNSSLIFSIAIRELYKEALAVPIFYSLYNINVIVMSIYWTTRSLWFKKTVNRLQKCWLNKTNNSTEVIILKATTVKTALGHTVKAQQTVEDYFKDLKRIWK